jgi:hypothetical protein
MSRAPVLARVLPALALLALAANVVGQTTPPPGEWRAFEGSWSATGTRQTLPTEGDGAAAVVEVSGAVVLTSGEGLSRGFLGQAIFFFDGKDLGVGRCVWTDERGDRIFSSLQGEVVETGRRIVGTITNGTGRYAGFAGEYSFIWQVVVQTEDGVIQGQTVGLKGRVGRPEVPK